MKSFNLSTIAKLYIKKEVKRKMSVVYRLAEYEELPTRAKRIVDEMCKDKRVMAFLSLFIGRALQENPMSDEEIQKLYNEMFPEKTEEEIREKAHQEYLEELKRKREKIKKK